jgi:hypothetical protein
MTRRNLLIANLLLALLGASGWVAAPCFAQKAAVPKPQDIVALAKEKVVEVVLLMNPDKKGKISKQEFMNLMEAEFDRLDKDRKGELDPKELHRAVTVRGATGR